MDGEGEALQPYQAYEKLLREWVPFLKAEINTCVDFLMLKDGGSQMVPQGTTMSFAGNVNLSPFVQMLMLCSILLICRKMFEIDTFLI